jgi:hypothetical protein
VSCRDRYETGQVKNSGDGRAIAGGPPMWGGVACPLRRKEGIVGEPWPPLQSTLFCLNKTWCLSDIREHHSTPVLCGGVVRRGAARDAEERAEKPVV